MNLERALSTVFGGVVMIAALTTVFGRSNTPRVLDSIGTATSNVIRAALGAGAGIR